MSQGDGNTPDAPDKPFLRDDEIGSELDAWDSTFDALHDPDTGTELPRSQLRAKPSTSQTPSLDSESRSAAGGDPQANWPDPHAPRSQAPTQPPDGQPDSDAPRSQAPTQPPDGQPDSDVPRSQAPTQPPDGQPDSDVPRSQAPTQPPDGQPDAHAMPNQALSSMAAAAGSRREPQGDFAEDEMQTPIPVDNPEDLKVYSSVPRPPQVPVPAPAVVKRTGPAIVRRAMPATKPHPISPPVSPSPERARRSETVELEVPHDERGALVASANEPGTQQTDVYDDDYADMEIGGSVASKDAGAAADIVAPRRTVAHVVRRPTTPTGPPIPKPEATPAAAAKTVNEAAPWVDDLNEADFSDVAAAGDSPPTQTTREGFAVDDVVTYAAKSSNVTFGEPAAAPVRSGAFDVEPSIDLDAIRFPEQVQPLSSSQFHEQIAQTLVVYQRELAIAEAPALHIEVARLFEHIGDFDRARAHYDAAVRADSRARPALRGLRRLAHAAADVALAIDYLETEMAIAGPSERRIMHGHHVDLLLSSGGHDRAQAVVTDVLAAAPGDIRALLATVELAAVSGNLDELDVPLERLAEAIADPELRAALKSVLGALAGSRNDNAKALTWTTAAAEAFPGSLASRLETARYLAAQNDQESTAVALLDVARGLTRIDPTTAAALAIRAQSWNTASAQVAAALAALAMPGDGLVTRAAAKAAIAGNDSSAAATALAAWAKSSASSAERAYAASRAAELEPDRGAEMWRLAFELDPGDDYAAAQLRAALIEANATAQAVEVDLYVAAAGDRERAQLRAAFGLMGEGQVDDAIAILERGHRDQPESFAVTEALAEAFASAGRWTDRARLLADFAGAPGQAFDRYAAELRSAVAWEEAVGAVADTGSTDPAELRRITESALEAWGRVIARSQNAAPAAHAAAIVLATRLGDSRVLDDVLARAQRGETSPWFATSLALRRARLVAKDAANAGHAEAVVRDSPAAVDDPRRALWLTVAAARRNDLVAVATSLEERAAVVGDTPESAGLRLRAAQLALDGGDAARAATLLEKAQQTQPALSVVSDLLAMVRRKSGDSRPPLAARPTSPPSADPNETFARMVRDADVAAERGDTAAAIALYQNALELRRGDPMASLPLFRVAQRVRHATELTALALAQLRSAETVGDGAAKAEAYYLLARVDNDLRHDAVSAQIALENALRADPSRIDLMFRLERAFAKADRPSELLRLRCAEHDQLPLDVWRDRAALLMDAASLAERDRRADAEVAELYRDALAADPRRRHALFRLESFMRQAGKSADLAQFEERVARYYEGDPRTQAAFYTRAGETLAEIAQVDAAVQKFAMAAEVLPGHLPALEGWRNTALRGQLWIDVAQATTRLAAVAVDAKEKARLHHFAGVVQMDKALASDQAIVAFRNALDADPTHKDAFIRLRILLEDDANHDQLAVLLKNRLEVEAEPAAKLELQRALAELHRNFLDARDTAKHYYREILAAEPNDLRAYAAIADIAWEQGNWQEAADALIARARLERDPATLSTLCFRLGLIYADRIGDPAMALRAFQRALTYQPDDVNTLVRLADLAVIAGEWQLALGACERLITMEQDADQRVAHLHRIAKVFKLGFNDAKRAERALNLALDGAPTHDEALAQLVQFYREAGDMTSVRVHLNRVIGAMRARVHLDRKDAIAYRVISRAMVAREAAGIAGSLPVACVAAELATLLGAAGDAEQRLVVEPRRVDLSHLARPDADEVLFPRGVATELRQVFRLLDDRVAKQVGVDIRAYGVERDERLRAGESSVAAHAQDVATALGLGEIDVYVSTEKPLAMVAEPTSPWSLIIGHSFAEADAKTIRFAAGFALKLAQTGLAVPARLEPPDLGVLVVSLIRLFQPEFSAQGLDEEAVAAQSQKLRRLIPAGLMSELKPFALAIDGAQFRYAQLADDLRSAALRAGLIASGSIAPALAYLAARHGAEFLNSREAQQLLVFAISEDHSNVAR